MSQNFDIVPLCMSRCHHTACIRPRRSQGRENAALKRTQRQRRSLLILIHSHWGLPLSHAEPESQGGGSNHCVFYALFVGLDSIEHPVCVLRLWVCGVVKETFALLLLLAEGGQTQRRCADYSGSLNGTIPSRRRRRFCPLLTAKNRQRLQKKCQPLLDRGHKNFRPIGSQEGMESVTLDSRIMAEQFTQNLAMINWAFLRKRPKLL